MRKISLNKRLAALGALPAAAGRGKSPQPVPLAQRLADLGEAQVSESFYTGFSTYLQGVEALTGSREEVQRASKLARCFRISPNMRCTAVVHRAFSVLEGHPDMEREVNNLLYALLIEPFSRMGCLPKNGCFHLPEDEEIPF